MCVQCTRFIQVLTRTNRSTIVLQCSLRAPTLTPKYIPRGISFFVSSRHPVLCTEPAYPVGTNRLGSWPNQSVPNQLGPRLLQPTRPMLSLYLNNSTKAPLNLWLRFICCAPWITASGKRDKSLHPSCGSHCKLNEYCLAYNNIWL